MPRIKALQITKQRPRVLPQVIEGFAPLTPGSRRPTTHSHPFLSFSNTSMSLNPAATSASRCSPAERSFDPSNRIANISATAKAPSAIGLSDDR